jgi:hypothetical protein
VCARSIIQISCAIYSDLFRKFEVKLLGKMADPRISGGGKAYGGAACVMYVRLWE